MNKKEKERLDFWENTAKRLEIESTYYREELVKAHALLGRIIQQTSERWDSVNLTKYYPTDNLWGKRNINNPGGDVESDL